MARIARVPAGVAWLLAGLAGVAVAAGVAGAVVLRDSPAPSRVEPFDEIAQSGAAESKGVTIRAIGASFSATETLLRVSIEATGMEELQQAVGTGAAILRLAPSGTDYSGPFAEGAITATQNSLGEVLLLMPPLAPSPGYDGTVQLRLGQMMVFTDSSTLPLQIEGTWVLDLQGPAPGELAEQLRVEELSGPPLDVAGAEGAKVSGTRSVSETRVVIELPPDRVMLTQPVLVVDGDQVAPRSFQDEGGRVTASFPPTPFGASFEVQLGAIAVVDNGSATAVSVDMRRALERAGDEGKFDILPDEILSGDTSLVLGGVQGVSGGRKEVGLKLAGNWRAGTVKPIFTDARGEELPSSGSIVSYTKDANGAVHEGYTEVTAFIRDDTDLGRFTVTLGAKTAVDQGVYSVTVGPVPGS